MFRVLTLIFTEKDIILIFASVLCSQGRDLKLCIFHLTEIFKINIDESWLIESEFYS